MVIPPVVKSQQKNEPTDKIPIVTTCWFNSLSLSLSLFLITIFLFFVLCCFLIRSTWSEKKKSNLCICWGDCNVLLKLEINFILLDCNLWPISTPFESIFSFSGEIFFTNTHTHARLWVCCFHGRYQTNIRKCYHLHLLVVSTNLLIVCIGAWRVHCIMHT